MVTIRNPDRGRGKPEKNYTTKLVKFTTIIYKGREGVEVRYAKTPWGIMVKTFTHQYGVTLKQICNENGVAESTLHAMLVGRTPAYDKKEKIDAYIEKYMAENEPLQQMRPIEEEPVKVSWISQLLRKK